MDDGASLEEQAEMARSFVDGLVDAFGLEGTTRVSVVEEDDAVEVEVDGDDLGLMIGPKGQTLVAVQELTRTVLQRQSGAGRTARVRVDAGGYRQRRREALARFATQLAEQVLADGSAKALEPMNAADRKVVHDTVNDIDGVASLSEGEDPRRYVVIVPDEDLD
jgi:spoIIIJ-associated protein